MLELTRELLLYILAGMSCVLVILIVLILRKRGMLNKIGIGGKKGDEVPKPPDKETGPSDSKAIKDTLKGDKDVPPPPPPKTAEKKKPAEGGDEVPPPAPVAEKGKEGVPKPPAGNEPPVPPSPRPPFHPPSGASLFPIEPGDEDDDLPPDDEGDVEQGMELDDAAMLVRGKPPQPPAESKPKEPAPVEPELPKAHEVPMPAATEEKSGPGILRKVAGKIPSRSKETGQTPTPSQKEQTEAITTATISGDPEGFKGHTVSIEGDLKLSSKGADDSWYVLFDSKGSAVVRSKEQIPLVKARLLAKVERTRLGQVYLDVIRYEKA